MPPRMLVSSMLLQKSPVRPVCLAHIGDVRVVVVVGYVDHRVPAGIYAWRSPVHSVPVRVHRMRPCLKLTRRPLVADCRGRADSGNLAGSFTESVFRKVAAKSCRREGANKHLSASDVLSPVPECPELSPFNDDHLFVVVGTPIVYALHDSSADV